MQCKAKKGQAPTHPKLLYAVNQFPKQNALYQKSACDKLIIMLNYPPIFSSSNYTKSKDWSFESNQPKRRSESGPEDEKAWTLKAWKTIDMTHQLSSRAESSKMSDLTPKTMISHGGWDIFTSPCLNIKSEADFPFSGHQWRGGEIATRCWLQKNSDCYNYWSFLFVSLHNKVWNIANMKIKRWVFLLSHICN